MIIDLPPLHWPNDDDRWATSVEAGHDEAFAILRDLIERVAVTPGTDGVEIELQGEIVAMVELLGSDAASPTDAKAALRRLHLDDGSRCSVEVVAGIGFEPMTFRL